MSFLNGHQEIQKIKENINEKGPMKLFFKLLFDHDEKSVNNSERVNLSKYIKYSKY